MFRECARRHYMLVSDMPNQHKVTVSQQDRPAQRWVAMIGASAALLGALIGGGSSYLVARQDNNAATDRDALAARRTAYATYYGDIAEYISLIETTAVAAQTAVRQRPIDEAALRRANAQLAAQTRIMFRDQAQVVLMGPKRIVDAAFSLNSSVARARGALTSPSLKLGEIEPILRDLAGHLDEFSAAAKADLEHG